MKTALALLMLSCAAVNADVFAKIPKTTAAAFEKAGGREVYSSGITVNGGKGKMSVYGFDETSAAVGRALSASLDIPDLARASADNGTVVFDKPEGNGRIVLVPGNAETSLAFEIGLPEKTGGDAPAKAEWPWNDVGMPPGAVISFSASAASGFSMASGTSNADPASAVSAIDSSLKTSGWTSSTPAASALSSALFSKGTEILVRTAVPDGTGGSKIAVFRRKLRYPE